MALRTQATRAAEPASSSTVAAVTAGAPVAMSPSFQHGVKKRNADGHYITNGSGAYLCDGWQAGTCLKTLPGTRCSNNTSILHECSICLQNDHGAAGHDAAMKRKAANKGGGGKGGDNGANNNNNNDNKGKGGGKRQGGGRRRR